MPPNKSDIEEPEITDDEIEEEGCQEVSDEQVRSTAVDLIQGTIEIEAVPLAVRDRVITLVGNRLKMCPVREPSADEIVRFCGGIRVDLMYELNRRIFEKFKLAVPPLPTLPDIISSFTTTELAVAGFYQKPALLLVPPNLSADDLMTAIARQSGSDTQRGPMISNPSSEVGDHASDAQDYFSAVLTEGVIKMMPFNNDSLVAPLVDRAQNIKAARYPGERGMTRKIYALLGMQSLTTGQLVDTNTFTVLDDEAIVTDNYIPPTCYMPIGHFLNGKPSFEWVPSGVEFSGKGRFRRVMGGTQKIVPAKNIGLFRRHPDL